MGGGSVFQLFNVINGQKTRLTILQDIFTVRANLRAYQSETGDLENTFTPLIEAICSVWRRKHELLFTKLQALCYFLQEIQDKSSYHPCELREIKEEFEKIRMDSVASYQ